MKIKTRITLSYLAILVLAAGLMGTILYQAEQQAVEERTWAQAEATIAGIVAQHQEFQVALEAAAESFNAAYISAAREVAARLVSEPALLDNDRLLALAKELDVDQINIYDDRGIVVNSSNPQYVGWDLDSSEFARPFLAAIGNKDFVLAQKPRYIDSDIDLFQYVGVSRRDVDGVVQIGLQAARYGELATKFDLKVTVQETKLPVKGSYVSVFTPEGKIIGHSNTTLAGQNQFEIIPQLKTIEEKKATKDKIAFIDEKGQQMFGYYQIIKDQTYLVSFPKDELLAPAYKQLKILFLVLTIGVFLGFIIFEVLLRILMHRPIAYLSDHAQRLAQGDFTVDLTSFASRKDELGVLGQSFFQMTEQLQALIEAIRVNAEGVAATSQEMAATSDETGSTAHEMAVTMDSMAQTAKQQRGIAETTKNQMAHLFELVADTNRSMMTVTQESAKVSTAAQNGKGLMEQAKTQINQIAKVSLETGEMIHNLGTYSNQIGGIVDIITGISEQTNMLALNAAIEAARAGEHGRGFAVVADEVRILAEESRKAAGEIAKLIQEIQNQVGQAISAIDSNEQEVVAGTETLGETITSFNEIENLIQSIAGHIRHMNDLVKNVETESVATVNSVDQIVEIIDDHVTSSIEAAAATDQLTAAVEEIATSADELARMANCLSDSVQTFKLTC